MAFEELSLFLRTGASSSEILGDVSRRKLLQPLTPGQRETLRQQGAQPALLNALESRAPIASPEEVAAYRQHHQAQAPQILSAPTAAAPASPVLTPPAATQPVLLSDRFTEGLEAAKNLPEQPVNVADAFSLDNLPEAKSRAERERKPIGFIMMAPALLNKPVTTRAAGPSAALLHFSRAFKESLVLVFVPMDTKKDMLPPAVASGFEAKELGGIVPNMVVVDATTKAFVLAVPSGNNKATGLDRDTVFAAAAAILQRWLSYHPMAIGVPEASQPGR